MWEQVGHRSWKQEDYAARMRSPRRGMGLTEPPAFVWRTAGNTVLARLHVLAVMLPPGAAILARRGRGRAGRRRAARRRDDEKAARSAEAA